MQTKNVEFSECAVGEPRIIARAYVLLHAGRARSFSQLVSSVSRHVRLSSRPWAINLVSMCSVVALRRRWTHLGCGGKDDDSWTSHFEVSAGSNGGDSRLFTGPWSTRFGLDCTAASTTSIAKSHTHTSLHPTTLFISLLHPLLQHALLLPSCMPPLSSPSPPPPPPFRTFFSFRLIVLCSCALCSLHCVSLKLSSVWEGSSGRKSPHVKWMSVFS